MKFGRGKNEVEQYNDEKFIYDGSQLENEFELDRNEKQNEEVNKMKNEVKQYETEVERVNFEDVNTIFNLGSSALDEFGEIQETIMNFSGQSIQLYESEDRDLQTIKGFAQYMEDLKSGKEKYNVDRQSKRGIFSRLSDFVFGKGYDQQEITYHRSFEYYKERIEAMERDYLQRVASNMQAIQVNQSYVEELEKLTATLMGIIEQAQIDLDSYRAKREAEILASEPENLILLENDPAINLCENKINSLEMAVQTLKETEVMANQEIHIFGGIVFQYQELYSVGIKTLKAQAINFIAVQKQKIEIDLLTEQKQQLNQAHLAAANMLTENARKYSKIASSSLLEQTTVDKLIAATETVNKTLQGIIAQRKKYNQQAHVLYEKNLEVIEEQKKVIQNLPANFENTSITTNYVSGLDYQEEEKPKTKRRFFGLRGR